MVHPLKTAGSAAPVDPKALPLSIGDLIMRRIRVLGSQQNRREYLYEALKFVAEGKVKPEFAVWRHIWRGMAGGGP